MDFVNFKHVVSGLCLLSLAACAGMEQTSDLEASGFLEPEVYDKLEPTGDELRAGLGYLNPATDFAKYDKMLLDPIFSFRSMDTNDGLSSQDAQILANKFFVALSEEFGEDYELVTQPEPGALRMKIALVRAEKKNVTLDTVSTVAGATPVGFAANKAATYISGKPVFTGQTKIEFELRDAMTRELAGAGIDSRAGGKVLSEDQFNAWSDVDAAFALYAKGMRYRLCLQRGETDCEAPAIY